MRQVIVLVVGLLLLSAVQGGEVPAEQRAKALLDSYRALDAKAQAGPEGGKLLQQLRALPGPLSPQVQDAIARLVAANNLRQLALPVHKQPAPEPTPSWVPHILPYLENPPYVTAPRSKWEYHTVLEGEIRKLGKNDLTRGLNKLGEDGWELTVVREQQFIFKRSVPAPTTPIYRAPSSQYAVPMFNYSDALPLVPAKELPRLALTKEQQQKLSAIEDAYRARLKQPSIADGTSNTLLFTDGQGLRKASLDQIAEMLTPEQRAIFQRVRNPWLGITDGSEPPARPAPDKR